MRLRFGDQGADLSAAVEVRSLRFYRAMLGSIGLGEAYRNGFWDCDDLVAAFRIAIRNLGSLDRWRRRPPPRPLPAAAHLWRVPGTAGARRVATSRPLRPRKRPIRALPRRVDDVLVRSLPHPGASLGRPRRTGWSGSARPSNSGPDHLLEIGTGWAGWPHTRRDAAGAGSPPRRSRASSGAAPSGESETRESRIGSPSCSRTTGISAAGTRSSSRSR
jgi:hypothetical protein